MLSENTTIHKYYLGNFVKKIFSTPRTSKLRYTALESALNEKIHTESTPEMPESLQNQFVEDCDRATDDLKVALINLYESVQADPLAPQDVARRFKINKNLTWKISRVLKAEDRADAIRHVPGSEGLEILVKKLVNAGANQQSAKDLRNAVLSFERLVDVHVGDRATLELVLDSMAPKKGDPLETSRKLAFRGNSGICGNQAKTRLTSVFMAPNPEDSNRLDAVSIAGYFGFRRIRTTASRSLFMFHTWNTIEGRAIDAQVRRAPLSSNAENNGDANGINLMREFCSDNLPELVASDLGMTRRHRLAPGPIGNLGAFDLVLGDVIKSFAPRYADQNNQTGEHTTTVVVPIENLIFDLTVHKDLAFAFDPEVVIYDKEWEPGCEAGDIQDIILPFNESMKRLSGLPPVYTTPLIPNYSEFAQRAFEKMGWDPKDFRGIRMHMKYPALDSTIVLRFPLEQSAD